MKKLLALLLLFGIVGCDNLSLNNKEIINLTLICELSYLQGDDDPWLEQTETQIIHIDVDLNEEEGTMEWENQFTLALQEINDKEITFYKEGDDIAVLNRTTLNIRAMFKKLDCKKADPI